LQAAVNIFQYIRTGIRTHLIGVAAFILLSASISLVLIAIGDNYYVDRELLRYIAKVCRWVGVVLWVLDNLLCIWQRTTIIKGGNRQRKGHKSNHTGPVAYRWANWG